MRKIVKASSLVSLLFSLLLCGNSVRSAAQRHARSTPDAGFTEYVNPYVGTAGADMGYTYPGAALPFGMIQWSPGHAEGVRQDACWKLLIRRQ